MPSVPGRGSGNPAQMAGLVFDGERCIDERVDRLPPPLEIMRGKKAFDRFPELVARHDREKRGRTFYELRVDCVVVGDGRRLRRLIARQALGDAADVELLFVLTASHSFPPRTSCRSSVAGRSGDFHGTA